MLINGQKAKPMSKVILILLGCLSEIRSLSTELLLSQGIETGVDITISPFECSATDLYISCELYDVWIYASLSNL